MLLYPLHESRPLERKDERYNCQEPEAEPVRIRNACLEDDIAEAEFVVQKQEIPGMEADEIKYHVRVPLDVLPLTVAQCTHGFVR